MAKKSVKPEHKKKPTIQAKRMPKPLVRKTAVASPTPTDPHTLSPTNAQALQRTIGNQALRRLAIQRKMTLGPVGDKYEQEADAVAKQVVNNLQAPRTQSADSETMQRQEEEELQMKPVSNISSLQRQEEEEMLQGKRDTLQRQEEEELQMKPIQRQEEEELQAKGDPMLAGGELSNDIEGAVHNAKSGGKQLDDTIRQPMEQAFNADFRSVKVHTDSRSDSLNRSLSARAFTSGQDIFFRNGEYSPTSNGGQELLAHELTHVVQQNGTQIQAQPKIQRMAFENTNWESAKTAEISSGGGGGAIIIKDKGDPIVVKASEDSSGEAMLFAQLFSGTMKDDENKSGDWRVETPGVRLADATESARIKGVLDNLLPDSPDDPRIARSKAALIDGSPTVIYSYAKGEDFGKYLYQAKKGKQGPKFKERLKAVSQLWTNPSFLHLLGKSTTIDIFMGNTDRLFLFNPDNFMVDLSKKKNRLSLIDNVFDAPLQGGKFETKTDFDQWVSKSDYSEELKDMISFVDEFKGDNFEGLARAAVGKIYDEVRYNMPNSIGEDLSNIMREQMDTNFGAMVDWFASGLAEAKGKMMIAVQHAENAIKDGELDLGNKQHRILRHLKARKLYLAGASAEEAWRLSSGFVKGDTTGLNRSGFKMGSRK